MCSIRRFSRLIIVCCFLLPGVAFSEELMAPLPAPPLGEQWFAIFMGNERTGFAHSTIGAASGGYHVISDSSTKMMVLGFSREAFSRESYDVNTDLSLRSFVVQQAVDGKPAVLRGEVTAKGVKVTVESAGGRQEKFLKMRGKLYPGPLLNLYPLMQGVVKGKKYRLQMLDVEDIKVKQVTITAVGMEDLPGEGTALHLRNNLYRLVDNDVWVDPLGHTVRESVRDGLIVTRAEDEEAAGNAIVEAAIAKAGWIVDFSLVTMDRPLPRPGELKNIAVEISGIPEGMPLWFGERQRAARSSTGSVVFTVDRLPVPAKDGIPASGTPAGDGQAENEQFIALKNEILEGEKDPVKAMARLARWVAVNVVETTVDDLLPLETLQAKKGNCQSHVRLYTALANAAGLPTRTVVGLVHLGGKGFLYHSWAESYAGGWMTVDPTLAQTPADATHIKLAEEGSSSETTMLAALMGQLKAKLVEAGY